MTTPTPTSGMAGDQDYVAELSQQLRTANTRIAELEAALRTIADEPRNVTSDTCVEIAAAALTKQNPDQ